MSAVMTLKDSKNITAGGYIGGIGAMVGIMATLPISGGHINPAVTVAFACTGRTPWFKVPHYLIGQYIGSFLAQLSVYAMFAENISHFDKGNRSAYGSNTSTGKIFVTFPSTYDSSNAHDDVEVTLVTCVVSELIASCFLLLGVCSIIDQKGCNVPSYLQPFFIASWICAVGTSLGFNTCAVLNPARDLAPRVFMTLIGYGVDPFKPLNGHYWYAVGIFAPHFGALIGVLLYDNVIGRNVKQTADDDEMDDLLDASTPITSRNNGNVELMDSPMDVRMSTGNCTRRDSKSIKGLYVTISEDSDKITNNNYLYSSKDCKEITNGGDDYLAITDAPQVTLSPDMQTVSNQFTPSVTISPYTAKSLQNQFNARRRSSRSLHSVTSDSAKKDNCKST